MSVRRQHRGPGKPITRRRALAILAAAAGLPLLGSVAQPGRVRAQPFEWRGRALGAEARLVLAHPDPRRVARVVELCLAEVARLERVFSLHLADSEIVRLNRNGRLGAASHYLRLLLAEAQRFGALSDGAFDPTVQPLWELYADAAARGALGREGPQPRRLERTRALVDFRGIELAGGGVALARPGMAVTLNGIAQGYITDRIADILRDHGFDRVMVQLGETFALAPPEGRSAWRVAIPDPAAGRGPVATFDLADRAVATSAGAATRFGAESPHHHLFDPATGRSAGRYLGVSVVARRATTADALSTALYLLPAQEGERMLRAAGGEKALYVLPDGRRILISPAQT